MRFSIVIFVVIVVVVFVSSSTSLDLGVLYVSNTTIDSFAHVWLMRWLAVIRSSPTLVLLPTWIRIVRGGVIGNLFNRISEEGT